MTAGAGVVHSEMPEAEFARTGGRLHGFQVWVNLPRRDKMIHPCYQEIPSAQIPTTTSVDGQVTVKVIAGRPLHEPVVRYGPFVMNTEAEIRQAINDYQSGRMGAITV